MYLELAEVLDDLKETITRRDRAHIVLRYLLVRGCSKQLFEKVLNMCPDPECDECGKLVCINGEPLHFHRDGCPGCDGKLTMFDQRRMEREDTLLWSTSDFDGLDEAYAALSQVDAKDQPETRDDDRGPSHT